MLLRSQRFVFGAIKLGVLTLIAFNCHVSAILHAEEGSVSFNRDIKPILSNTCFKCHGPAGQKGGVRLDLREEATKPADSGERPIIPGKPDDSELVRRILSTEEGLMMPPPAANRVLTAEQKALLKRWVAEGADYQKHWSFVAPVKVNPPAAPTAGYRVVNPIDGFIADRLRKEKLTMSPEADRETLIRRVAFATTGLPPTIKEVDEFLADTSEAAYERMVDRYLKSPRYGEEMARHWLDVARYGDTHGLHLDNERQMWAYRDWVVKSFNANKPFDQFTVEQIAGDLLSNATLDQVVATGFSRCNVTTGEGGSIDEEWVFRNALDRTTTMAGTWLGLTAGCCVCHEHKFDPLSTKDYYSLYAFFHSSADPPLDGNALLTAPSIKLTSDNDAQKFGELDGKIAALQKQLDEQAAQAVYSDPALADPRPLVSSVDDVWFDDEIPGGKLTASPGAATQFVTSDDGQVLSGKKSLQRTDPGLAQDVIDGTPPLTIPGDAKLYAHVWIDPDNRPRSLMLQYFKGGWLHRAVWGDYGAIDWGKPNSTERVLIGEIPEAGKWVRLEVEASRLGLSAGDQVTGFALTQFGGHIFWDKVGVAGRTDPAADPRRSLTAWRKQQQGKEIPGAPGEINQAIRAPLDQELSADLAKRLRDYYVQQVCLETKPKFEPILNELTALRRQKTDLEAAIPGSFVFRDLAQPRQSFVMLRGQYDKPGEKVEPGVPAVLPPLNKANPEGRATRLDLAHWLVSNEQPLTPRVTVNRFWQQVFGIGLVKTSYDFGSQGELPSHPELLDWLASSFRESGWDIRQLMKLMLMSATFRQSSAATPDLLKHDPENRLYARGPRFRLDAEQLRDNALFVSGLINLEMGGRGVRPYQPPNIWEPVGFVGSNTANYTQDHGPALYRRSLYIFFKRTAPPPFMSNFDAPNREQSCARRDRSNTPLQALQLMNDVQHFEAARGLAEQIMTAGGSTTGERIVFAYRTVLSRRPNADEAAVVEKLFQKQLTKYQAYRDAAAKVIRNGESTPRAGLDEPELAAWTLVANLLLNLDETVSRN